MKAAPYSSWVINCGRSSCLTGPDLGGQRLGLRLEGGDASGGV